MADDTDLDLDSDESTEEEEFDDDGVEDEEDDESEESDDDESEDDPEEARRGQLRMADYTRKTQEVARLRKELEAQLTQVQAMRQFFEQGVQPRASQPPEDTYVDPLEVELAQTRAAVIQLQQQQAAQRFQSQAERLADLHGIEDTKDAPAAERILALAVEGNGMPLDLAAELLAARDARMRSKSQKEQIRQFKRGLPPSAAGTRGEPRARTPRTEDDAFEAAWRASGGK